MAEDCGKLVSGETRHALGDLTNLPRKRLISSILGDLLHKPEGEPGKNVAHEGSRVEFSKRLCVVVDDLVKENDTNQGSSSDCKISSGVSDDKESGESRDAAMVEISSGEDKLSKEIYFEPGDRDGARESNAAGDALALSALSGDTESRNPLVIREELPQCQSLRSFEMSRCSNVNQNMGHDLLKSCSCSFCLEAAYIWSDLHYQDIKGRLSALKKSQKQASNLIQRNGKDRPTDFHASANSANIESDLMGQWRSLFLSMGDILAHESNQLQNSFLTMKELREDCKIDLERAMKTSQEHTK